MQCIGTVGIPDLKITPPNIVKEGISFGICATNDEYTKVITIENGGNIDLDYTIEIYQPLSTEEAFSKDRYNIYNINKGDDMNSLQYAKQLKHNIHKLKKLTKVSNYKFEDEKPSRKISFLKYDLNIMEEVKPPILEVTPKVGNMEQSQKVYNFFLISILIDSNYINLSSN